MKTGIFIAVVLHVAFLLFGGLIFNTHKDEKAKIVVVDLEDPQTVKKEEPKPLPEEAKIEPAKEAPPDASGIIRDMEQNSGPPALAQIDLGGLSALLNGNGGGEGGFGQGDSVLTSGGVIGGRGGRGGTAGVKEDEAFSAAEIDQKPRALFQASPVFPAEMRGKNIDGAVVLIFIVDTQGRVTNQRAESSNNAAFEKPALEAVRQWKFEPGLRSGQRVSTRMRVTIRFQRS